jgi:steroid delta-isomerase-like uncharacterized protein
MTAEGQSGNVAVPPLDMLARAVSTEENKQVVRRWIELWNQKAADGVDEIFAEDFQDEQLTAFVKAPVSLEVFKASLQALVAGMGHAQFEEHEMIAEGDQVMVRWTARGVHQGSLWGLAPTGKPIAMPGVNIFRVRDGKIVERWSFIEPGAILNLAQGN